MPIQQKPVGSPFGTVRTISTLPDGRTLRRAAERKRRKAAKKDNSSRQRPSKNYWCPECDTWMDRAGFNDFLGSDYQEQLCKVCDTEVCHEFDL